MTSFDTIIDAFLSKITDDMYLELTEEDTLRDAKQYLIDAIPYFEFPRFALWDYDAEQGVYNVDLTREEINIFAILMKQAWLDRQINSVENTRMKYSGSDFKFTSQANHLQKLLTLKTENHRENIHAQRLYKRRRQGHDGRIMSNWAVLNQSALSNEVINKNSIEDENLINNSEHISTLDPVTPVIPYPISSNETNAYWEAIEDTLNPDSQQATVNEESPNGE